MESQHAKMYRRAKIAMITGWTFDHIDSLGLLETEGILQVWEGEQKLKAQPAKKGKH